MKLDALSVHSQANSASLLSAQLGHGARGEAPRIDGPAPRDEGRFGQALDESAASLSSGSSRHEEAPGTEPRGISDQAEAKPVRDDAGGDAGLEREGQSHQSGAGGRDPSADDAGQSGGAMDTSTSGGDAAQANESDLSSEAALHQSGAGQAQAAQATAAHLALLPGVVAGQAAQQVSEQSQSQAAAVSAEHQQAQAALAQAATEQAMRSAAQQSQGIAQAAAASALQSSADQPGAQADAGGEQARGESALVAALNTNSPAAGEASLAGASFAITEQAGRENALPSSLNPSGAQASAAKATPEIAMPSQASDSDAVNTSRLTRGLANAVQQRGGSVTLRLTPAEMGTVRIQMQITGASVNASFHAESASAQALLTQQLSQLRSALESQGMSVERLSVQPMAGPTSSQNTSQSGSDSQSQGQDQGQSGEQHASGDGRSRGQYSRNGSQPSDSSTGQAGDQASAWSDEPRGFQDQLNQAERVDAA